MNFLKIVEVPITHVTHINADPDSFAGVLWGKYVFGGCSMINNPDIATKNLMKKLKFKEKTCNFFTTVFFYDVEKFDRMPCLPERIIIFDHHPRNEFLKVESDRIKVFHKKRASLSMYLYDLSVEAGVKIEEEVLTAFAVALVTDTAFLRTARSEELLYLSKFLNNKKLEDIFEIVLGGRIHWRNFLRDLNNINFCENICYGHFSNKNHFLFFVDSIMYAMSCDIVIGTFEWGTWVYTKKSQIQKVFKLLKEIEMKGYKRKNGKIYGFRDIDILLQNLCDK